MVTTRNKTNTDTAADARQANASTKKNTPAKCKTEEDEEYFPGPGPDSDGEDSLNHDDNLDDEERSLCSTNDSITHGDDVSCLSDSDTDDLTNNVDGINDNDDADDSSLNALLGPENKKMLPLPSKVVTVLKRGAKSLKSLKDKVKSAFGSGSGEDNDDSESAVSSDDKSYNSYDSIDDILAAFKGLATEEVKNRPHLLPPNEELARQMQFPVNWGVKRYDGRSQFSFFVTDPTGWNTHSLSEAMSRAGITEVYLPHTQEAFDLARSLGYPEHYGVYPLNTNMGVKHVVYDLTGKSTVNSANQYVLMLKDDIGRGMVGTVKGAVALLAMTGVKGRNEDFMKLAKRLAEGDITSFDWKEFRILMRDLATHPVLHEGWLPQHKTAVEKMISNRASKNSNGNLVAKVNNTIIGMEGSGSKLFSNVLEPSTFHATLSRAGRTTFKKEMRPMNNKDVAARPSSLTWRVYTIEYYNAASHGEYVAGLREEYKAVAESEDEENVAPPTKRSRRK